VSSRKQCVARKASLGLKPAVLLPSVLAAAGQSVPSDAGHTELPARDIAPLANCLPGYTRSVLPVTANVARHTYDRLKKARGDAASSRRSGDRRGSGSHTLRVGQSPQTWPECPGGPVVPHVRTPRWPPHRQPGGASGRLHRADQAGSWHAPMLPVQRVALPRARLAAAWSLTRATSVLARPTSISVLECSGSGPERLGRGDGGGTRQHRGVRLAGHRPCATLHLTFPVYA
jgi:hypothetical protein